MKRWPSLTIGVRLSLLSALAWLPGLAWAHAAVRHEHGNPWLQFALDYWVGLPLLISLLAYLLGIQRMRQKRPQLSGNTRKRLQLFLAGWASLVLALLTPVDSLGNEYFSMHMVQHELLMIVAAPLLVLARPLAVWAWAMPGRRVTRLHKLTRYPLFARIWQGITHPFSAWAIHALVLWGWHVPTMFENALHRSWLHDLQHLSFFFSALLFWWSLLRMNSQRSPAIFGLISLFTTAVHTALLGALLTFSSRVWYHSYIITSGGLQAALQDQQLGGLIMWIPGGLSYLIVTLLLCYKLLHKTQGQYAHADSINSASGLLARKRLQ
ncbi:MAG: cytochrome c oxidase assembly protein [Methylobacillus glycogenes]|nr:cytochrome c oxidase assembly protein [Methylobacillus glycogenes]